MTSLFFLPKIWLNNSTAYSNVSPLTHLPGISQFGGFNCLGFFQTTFWACNGRCCQSHSAYFHIYKTELSSLGLLLIYGVKKAGGMLRWWWNPKNIHLILLWWSLWLLLLEQETNSSCEIQPVTTFTHTHTKSPMSSSSRARVIPIVQFLFPFLAPAPQDYGVMFLLCSTLLKWVRCCLRHRSQRDMTE